MSPSFILFSMHSSNRQIPPAHLLRVVCRQAQREEHLHYHHRYNKPWCLTATVLPAPSAKPQGPGSRGDPQQLHETVSFAVSATVATENKAAS